MLKQILVPLDRSQASRTSLQVACNLAVLSKGRVFGLFIEDERWFYDLPLTTAIAENITGNPLVGTPLPPEKILQVEERVEAEGQELFKRFESACAAQSVEGRFLTFRGNPLNLLVQRSKSVDIVVMHRDDREEGEGGENTAYPAMLPSLLRETSRPVLLVGEQSNRGSGMVVAYDGSKASDRALAIAAEFAEVTEIQQVHLLTVSNDPESAKQIQLPAHEYLSGFPFEIVDMWVAGKASDAIREYAHAAAASVVVIGAFGSPRLSELIFGSTTEQLLSDLNLSMLLVP